jgi:methylmalonyl-CoA mutase C-terminal domain/subunit
MTRRASNQPPIRVILAKCGLDAHERGVHVVAIGLRNLGFEVMYLGLRKSPEEIVTVAIEEDAEVIGLSSLSGGHVKFVARIVEILRRMDFSPLLVLGGVVPDSDVADLVEAGVHTVYRPGTPVSQIAEELSTAVELRRRHMDRGVVLGNETGTVPNDA